MLLYLIILINIFHKLFIYYINIKYQLVYKSILKAIIYIKIWKYININKYYNVL